MSTTPKTRPAPLCPCGCGQRGICDRHRERLRALRELDQRQIATSRARLANKRKATR